MDSSKQSTLDNFFSSPGKNTNEIKDSTKKIRKKLNTKTKILQNSMISSEVEILSSFSTDMQQNQEKENEIKKEIERYAFMLDIRDNQGRKPTDEGYDKSKLFISEGDLKVMTPFERQFWLIKKEYYDTIVCFKKGKFYELYENDAEIGSKLFDMRIADRVNMKMAGFPVTAFDHWAGKFLEKGYKIARVDQRENMIGKRIREREEKEIMQNKKVRTEIIDRELKEIITEGTVYNYSHIKTAQSVYLACIKYSENFSASIILYDACINEIYYKTFYKKIDQSIQTVLAQFNVKEIISEQQITGRKVQLPIKGGMNLEFQEKFEKNDEYLCYLYLENYMNYLQRDEFKKTVIIKRLSEKKDHMILDNITLKNLNILDPKISLFNSINFCSTACGQRLLRKWLLYPLGNKEEIIERQNVTKELEKYDIEELKIQIGKIGDLDRLTGKLNNQRYELKDLNIIITNLVHSCEFIDKFSNKIESNELLSKRFERHKIVSNNLKMIIQKFKTEYNINEKEICMNDPSVDEFVLYSKELEKIEQNLKKYLEEQKKRLHCKLLCYKDIGKEIFQIEAPSTITVPTSYFLTSCTKTTKRYYTQDLKAILYQYDECKEKIFQAKGLILIKATKFLLESYQVFYNQSDTIAEIDCFFSFVTFSRINTGSQYPVFSENLKFKNIRNPIFPDYLGNDFNFDENHVLLLTGPNMAGKSTLLRTICLNVILGQMGMKIIADEMEMKIFNRIFTRLGASDDLLRGESTFMIEMKETSVILNECTKKSLIIIDELGRGTSTKDGEAIARAVIEYLNKKQVFSIFATHYHKIVEKIQNVKKGYMDAIIEDEDIIFLFKLKEGICYDSQGIPVARLAGVPDFVTKRASEVRKLILQNDLSK